MVRSIGNITEHRDREETLPRTRPLRAVGKVGYSQPGAASYHGELNVTSRRSGKRALPRCPVALVRAAQPHRVDRLPRGSHGGRERERADQRERAR